MLEKFKQYLWENIFIRVFIGIFILILIFFYFKIFFTKGIYFYGIFLKKQVLATETHYIGNSKKGSIEIIAKGELKNNSSVEVTYKLPNNNQRYTVNFQEVSSTNITIQNIKDKNDNIIFSEGWYSRDIACLNGKDGSVILDMQLLVNDESPYNSNYITYPENEISLSNVVSFAAADKEVTRGKPQYLVPAIFLFIFTLIDIKFPLFFFTMRNSLQVKDPEPSEFYIDIQRKLWVINPIIGIIFMLIAIH